MPASEIDDIFSGKSKDSHTLLTEASGSTHPNDGPLARKKKARSKKRKREQGVHDDSKQQKPLREKASKARNGERKPVDDEHDASKSETKKVKRVVETIVDPSVSVNTPKVAIAPNAGTGSKAKKGRKAPKEDLDRFKDSRGTGPRKTTDEGFLVYKEDELGIQDEGGDTPLCPFDCGCCF